MGVWISVFSSSKQAPGVDPRKWEDRDWPNAGMAIFCTLTVGTDRPTRVISSTQASQPNKF